MDDSSKEHLLVELEEDNSGLGKALGRLEVEAGHVVWVVGYLVGCLIATSGVGNEIGDPCGEGGDIIVDITVAGIAV